MRADDVPDVILKGARHSLDRLVVNRCPERPVSCFDVEAPGDAGEGHRGARCCERPDRNHLALTYSSLVVIMRNQADPSEQLVVDVDFPPTEPAVISNCNFGPPVVFGDLFTQVYLPGADRILQIEEAHVRSNGAIGWDT